MLYNTQRKSLPMPEYGRAIQDMVDYALTLTDRDERQQCANTIVKVMGNMFPHLRDVPDFKHKLWDHLAIMADYKLDIDYPFEITPKSEMQKPGHLNYPGKRIRFRHYGYLLESLIAKLPQVESQAEREALTLLIAGQMKRDLVNWNKDVMNEEKIVGDLSYYLHQDVDIDRDELHRFLNACEGGHVDNTFQNKGNVSRKNNKKKN